MRDIRDKKTPARVNLSSDKLLSILEIMAEQPEPLRLYDIARLCGMNASTVLRFLSALEMRNYVAQDMDTGRYFLTFKICALAQSMSASHAGIRSVAMPFLRSVSHVFSESCNLAIENDLSIMYVEVVSGPQKTLMSMQRIGNIAPMHCTGVGKLILTDYSTAELDRLLAVKKLTGYTQNTITARPVLLRELSKVKAAGYAFDNEECEVGARCVAAPIRDYTGRIIAGLSVSGPTARMTDRHIRECLPCLLDSAGQISLRLGWEEKAPNFTI
ncbi:MAG: IclR family transcriptional regulator [Oscillospiraceae bacterium]|jgi:DNA-binding IclR family transcriptional regulator|nr:IclR family transcriptional regulator [Oscillospiraceae bacterium]